MALIYQEDFDEFNSYRDTENDNDLELSRIAMRYGTQDTPAADIRQEFWLMDFVRRHFSEMEFRGETRLRGWCLCEMRMVAKRLFERTYPRKSQPGHPGRPTALPGSHSTGDDHQSFDLESSDPSPASAVELEDEIVTLQSAIDALEAKSRQVIRMKQFQRMTFKEIGQELKISPGKASKIYLSAIQQLQRSLAPTFEQSSAFSGESK